MDFFPESEGILKGAEKLTGAGIVEKTTFGVSGANVSQLPRYKKWKRSRNT